MFVKLKDRLVVVVGGGTIAEGKIEGLLAADARIRVISPAVTSQVAKWKEEQRIDWWAKPFESADLHGAHLVIAAASVASVNETVFREAEARGIFCNAVDDPERCHFYYGAVVQRGDLQIAISTNGKSPALAQRLRQDLEGHFGPEYEIWLEWLGAARESLRASNGNAESNKAVLHELASPPMFRRFLQETRRNALGRGVA
jgi:siroheme synthase-like protein